LAGYDCIWTSIKSKAIVLAVPKLKQSKLTDRDYNNNGCLTLKVLLDLNINMFNVFAAHYYWMARRKANTDDAYRPERLSCHKASNPF
jgi:hypothetical protein